MAASLTAACSSDEQVNPPNDPPDADPLYVPEYKISGSVVDWSTGNPVAGTATLAVEGVSPPPSVQIDGASFVVDGIPPGSVVYLRGGGPDYRYTYSQAVEVLEADVTDVQAKVLSETYVTELAAGFQVTPAPGTGIVLAKVYDQAGAALAGVPKDAFYLNGATPPKGPYFLDADKQPDRNLTATSASGYVVFFDVPPGTAAVTEAPGANYSLSMAVSPTASEAVTLARIDGIAGEPPPPPLNPSFANEIVPIFQARSCTFCHAGGGAGRQDGGLSLKVGANQLFEELTVELSPGYQIPRVNLENPEQSLILTMPGPTPDNHPNTTFASYDDPDYVLILAWITAGAQQN